MQKTGKEYGRSFRVVLLATFVGFCAFYAPQPLLPTFAREFDVSMPASAWLLTLPFVCLAVGPILVGTVLQRASAQRVLSLACLGLAVSLMAFALAGEFVTLLVFRAVQAAMMPVLFTAAVTYCSRAGRADSQQTRIAMYITATIVGGFVGRLFGGFAGDAFGWQAPFMLLGFASLICAVLVWFFVDDIQMQGEMLRAKAVVRLLARRDTRAGLALVFTAFFAFTGALNVIPFRLVELQPDIQASRISVVYIGYSVGIFIPLVLRRLVKRAGGEVPILYAGYGLLLSGLCTLFVPNVFFLTFVFLVLSMGLFTIHATTSGLLNSQHPDNASVVNGAYISNYYAAAAVGSIIPVWLFQIVGWNAYVVLQIIFVLPALAFLYGLRHFGRKHVWCD